MGIVFFFCFFVSVWSEVTTKNKIKCDGSNVLSLPILFFFLFKAKMGNNKKSIAFAFYFLLWMLLWTSSLQLSPIFFFLRLEVKMGDDSKLVVVTFYFLLLLLWIRWRQQACCCRRIFFLFIWTENGQQQEACCYHFFCFYVIVVVNKAIAISLLPLPIFLFYLKWRRWWQQACYHLLFFLWCCCKKSNGKSWGLFKKNKIILLSFFLL